MAQPAYSLPIYSEAEDPKFYPSLTQSIAPSNLLGEPCNGGGSIIGAANIPQAFYTFAYRTNRAALAILHDGSDVPLSCPAAALKNISISTTHGQARPTTHKVKHEDARPSLLMSELKQISKLKKNWDGEGAEKPSLKTLRAVRSLLELATKTMSAQRERTGLSRALWLRLSSPLPDLNVSANQQLASSARPVLGSALEAGLTISGAIQTIAQPEGPSESDAALYPTIDGSVTLKWIYRGRELKCTITEGSVEVVRWKSDASYESDGLWDLAVEQTREHFEWLMR